MKSPILPWHKAQWQSIQRQIAQSRLPHAILLTGVEGVGKKYFAELLAESLLCQDTSEEKLACGACRACQWLQAGSHPDRMVLAPEEEGKAIKIDQVRQLIDRLSLSAHQASGYKVVTIHPADAMNMNSANAFLKTLEEPAKDTLMLLITHRASALPATVRSRCREIYFPVPDKREAMQWFKDNRIDHPSLEVLWLLAKGAPFKVKAWIEQDEMVFRQEIYEDWLEWIEGKKTLVAQSECWSKKDLSRVLLHVFTWVEDMIKFTMTGEMNPKSIVNLDIAPSLQSVANLMGTKKLFQFYEKLLSVKAGHESPLHLNEQLLIEDLLLTWSGE